MSKQTLIQSSIQRTSQIKVDVSGRQRAISQKDLDPNSKYSADSKSRPINKEIMDNYYGQKNQNSVIRKPDSQKMVVETDDTKPNIPPAMRITNLKTNQQGSTLQTNLLKIQFSKVIGNQTPKLILRPNGNVVRVKQNKVDFYQVKIYINSSQYISLPLGDFENEVDKIYEGYINSENFLPQGLGKFSSATKVFRGVFNNGLASSKETYLEFGSKDLQICSYEHGQKHGNYWFSYQDGIQIIGQFGNNLRQGTFEVNYNGKLIEKSNYINDVLVEKSNSYISGTSTRYLFTHKQYSINNWAYEGLTVGNWLNQLTVDYYLQLIHDYFSYVNKKKILLITTILCQDIFSSQITQINDNQIQIIPEIEEKLRMLTSYDRVIFVMNVDRGHFVVLVYQNNVLYMLNSLPYSYDAIILDKVQKMFKSKPKTELLPVAQQQNGYDCGVHSIYNVILQYRFINKPVPMIDYSVTKDRIRNLRMHIKNVIIGDYAHLIK